MQYIIVVMSAILLENVRSILNVGGIFRIADAVGAERLLLVGYTPCPVDRMGRENTKMSKTALGAEKTIPWQHYETAEQALTEHSHYTPIVVEQTDRAVPYTDITEYQPDSLFIFGNETEGVSPETCELVKRHIYLPMHGKKESLNITTCTAVILYHAIQ